MKKDAMTLYLSPRYIGEGFMNFFVNLHKILLFTLFLLLCSLPIVTFGGALIAYNAALRALARDEKFTVREFFQTFRKKIVCGIPYTLIFASIVFLLSLPISQSAVYYISQFCAVLAFCLTMNYPVAAYSLSNVPRLFANSALYALGHLLQTLTVVCVALIVLLVSVYTSEFLAILMFPIFYFVVNRIVLANNAQIEQRQEEQESAELENKLKGDQIS